MNKKHGKKIALVILVSFILVLSSSLFFMDQPQSSGNPGVSSSSFIAVSYNVTFTASGLTSGTQWEVTLNSVSEMSTANSIVFSMVNGSYAYTIGTVAGFNTTPSAGFANVTGAALPITITFTKLAPVSLAPVNLGTAANYTILTETGITNTGTSSIAGNIAVSPAASTYITGFTLTLNSTGQFATSPLVTGKVYAATYSAPTPAILTTAVSNMTTAYTDAAGIANPNYVNLGAGNLNGLTLVPGLYKWDTAVSISTNLTLTGNSSSVWIFQISGGLTFGNGAHIILSGGAQAKNIFWQVSSGATIGTGASFYGIILSATAITIGAGTNMTGLALTQTAVTLDADIITSPSVAKIIPPEKYNVTFTESGLTSGTQWEVTLNSVSETSTTNSTVFSVVNGSYTYTIGTVPGFNTTSNTGSANVVGAALPITITFTKMPPVILSPVNLGTAANYAVLAETGISTTGTTSIVGNIGVSPAASTYITGFSLVLNSTTQFATSSMVTGKVYAATYAPPTPAMLTTAVGDMQTAYTDAAGIANPNYVNLGSGNLNGMTLVPGLYKWGTGVYISTNITLTGNSSSVWIFQISGGLTFGNGAHIILTGGAQPKNIFWQVASGVTIGTGASFYGIILSQTAITIATGSTLTGLALAQSAVTLQSDTITATPAPQIILPENYSVSFTESDLLSGTWYVNVTNSTGHIFLGSSTASSISFNLTNGSYTYTVQTSNKIYHANGGSFTVNASSNKAISVAFSSVKYSVTFTETGLPSGTWYANVTNSTTGYVFLGSSTASSISFNLTNGSYTYTVQTSNKIYEPSSSYGTATVNGQNVLESVTFSSVKYSVTFTETGLPSGTWYANVTNSTTGYVFHESSTASAISLTLTNGSYTYTIVTTNKIYHANGGSFTVNASSNKAISVTFTSVKYSVTFTETGLPSGTAWYVNLTGMASSGPITASTYTVSLTNGSYTYTASSTDKPYSAVNGTLSVNGHSTPVTVKFSTTSKPASGISNTDIYIIAGVVVALAIIGTAATMILRKRGSK